MFAIDLTPLLHAMSWMDPYLAQEGVWQSILLTGGCAMMLVHSRVTSFWLHALLAFPGVFLHESLHWLAGVLLGASPTGFSVFPERYGNHYLLGSVTFRSVNVFNAIFIAMAPVLLLPLAVWCFYDWVLPAWYGSTYGIWAGFCYLTASIALAAMPSSIDFRMSAASFLLYGLLVWTGWWVWHLNG